jgi:hypothetical protein
MITSRGGLGAIPSGSWSLSVCLPRQELRAETADPTEAAWIVRAALWVFRRETRQLGQCRQAAQEGAARGLVAGIATGGQLNPLREP